MKWIKSSLYFGVFSILCLDFLPGSYFTAQAKAESFSREKNWQISQTFKPPKRAAPPPSAGGSSRGSISISSCVKSKKQLTSIMPPNKLGLTLAERPTFFWYVPESSAKIARFMILTDNNEKTFYETTVALPNKPGIISFKLPSTAPQLVTGKSYHWYLTVICNTQNLSANPLVDGWVERTQVGATLSAALAKAQPHNLPNLYAEAGIWHEALATSAQLRHHEPQNLQVRLNWWSLLKSVNLTSLASEKFIDCCTSEQAIQD